MSRKKNMKGRIVGISGNISGVGSIISAHNVCHTLCLAVVAVLSVFGIIVSSNVLMFLEDYNLLFWSMGISFLAMSLFLYSRYPGCISKKIILANVGLLIIGTPFQFLQPFNLIFWISGGSIVFTSFLWYLKGRVL